jgi:hypothetical protein
MRLTTEQRDRLLVQIAEKLGIQLDVDVGPTTKPVNKTRKPFPDSIGMDEGLAILTGLGPIGLLDFARNVEVKRSDLEAVANSLGVKCLGPIVISDDDLRLIWRTYCNKRGW